AFLRDQAASGGLLLLVEDDVADRSDPGLRGRYGYVGDVVMRWTNLAHSSAVELLRQGASGYPLNAYLLTRPGQQLGLDEGRDIVGPALEAIIRATCCVIVSSHDAETYVALSL